MAWDLRGNMDEEIERAVLLKTLTPQQVDQLFPPYPADHPVIVNKLERQFGKHRSSRCKLPLDRNIPSETLEALSQNVSSAGPGARPGGHGDRIQLLGHFGETDRHRHADPCERSTSCASRCHRSGTRWTCIACRRATACPYDVAGFSFAGVPGVIIGHNADIAWGFTNTGPDVMDLFIEKVNPDNPNQYEVGRQMGGLPNAHGDYQCGRR